MESIPWGTVKCVFYKQAVFIYRWSLEKVGLYIYNQSHYVICDSFKFKNIPIVCQHTICSTIKGMSALMENRRIY